MPNSAVADLRLLQAFWREPVARHVLPNGLTLLVQPSRSAPVAAVQVWIKTGSIHEDTQLGAGLSHFLEHMMFKGTARRAGREISATVQAHGGHINAYTTFDRTVYYIDLPAAHAGLALDVLADITLHSTLPAGEFVKEREVILREIAMTRDDPDNRLAESLFATAFREHPYRHPIIGHRDVFSVLTRDDLLTYYRTRYVPDNLVVVVAGDVDPAAVLADVQKHFGPTPRARLAPVFIPAEPVQLAPRALHTFEDVELTRAGLAWPVPGLTHADAPALDLLAALLGQGDSSVLWQAVREKARLVHHIDATCWSPGGQGLFYISFACEPGKRHTATTAIHRELARAATRGFTPAQIRKAVRQAVVGEVNTRKTMGGIASRLGLAEVVAGDLNFGEAWFQRLARVTSAALRRVLRDYLTPTTLTAISLNPAAARPAAPAEVTVASTSPDFIEEKLPNGARLLLQRDSRLPNLHVRVVCAGGPLQDPAGRRGAGALMATLLTRDTRRRTAAEVARFIEEVGGSFYPFAGNNSFGFAAEVLPGDVSRALALVGDALLAPTFTPQSFEIERDAQIASLKEQEDDVVELGRKHVRQKFFGAHPLALDAHGDIPGLTALTPTEITALWRRLVVAGNVILVVAGNFDPSALAPKLRTILAKLSPGPSAVGLTTSRHSAWSLPANPGDFIEKEPREQAVVFQAFPGPSVLDGDFYVGEVADELFSGMSSRLFERVREEKGLAYFVRATRVTGSTTGMFYFYAGTAPGKEDAVLAELDAEIARVSAGDIAPDELFRCQTRLQAARVMGQQTNSARAMQASLSVLHGQPANDWKNYDARISAVTIAHLRDFARRRLQRALRTQLVVRP
ncbi:MAG: pitrilysin family protein [Verrucomicrobiota bacterium]